MRTAEVEISPPRSDQEIDEFVAILVESLGFPCRADIDWLPRYQTDDFRLARVGGRVAGGGILLRFGQWFGGREVDMVGIHGVGISPEFRGRGVGSALMAAIVTELGAAGVGLSTLYPATEPVYRAVGYEHAGSWTRYRLPIAKLRIRGREPGLEPVGFADASDLQLAYDARARREAGNLARNAWCWQRILDPLVGPVYGYRVGAAGSGLGHSVFSQRRRSSGLHDYDIVCHELVASDGVAARRLLTMFADHRSLAVDLLVTSSPAATELIAVDERCVGVDEIMRWMMRITDVGVALTQRGYPPDLRAELTLDIDDGLIEANRGRHTLRVADGAATLAPGGAAAALAIDVRGLAALYSGHLSAEQLAGLGLAAASAEILARASHIFAGPAPWMAEIF